MPRNNANSLPLPQRRIAWNQRDIMLVRSLDLNNSAPIWQWSG